MCIFPFFLFFYFHIFVFLYLASFYLFLPIVNVLVKIDTQSCIDINSFSILILWNMLFFISFRLFYYILFFFVLWSWWVIKFKLSLFCMIECLLSFISLFHPYLGTFLRWFMSIHFDFISSCNKSYNFSYFSFFSEGESYIWIWWLWQYR